MTSRIVNGRCSPSMDSVNSQSLQHHFSVTILRRNYVENRKGSLTKKTFFWRSVFSRTVTRSLLFAKKLPVLPRCRPFSFTPDIVIFQQQTIPYFFYHSNNTFTQHHPSWIAILSSTRPSLPSKLNASMKWCKTCTLRITMTCQVAIRVFVRLAILSCSLNRSILCLPAHCVEEALLSNCLLVLFDTMYHVLLIIIASRYHLLQEGGCQATSRVDRGRAQSLVSRLQERDWISSCFLACCHVH
jgi:hypothetical protein